MFIQNPEVICFISVVQIFIFLFHNVAITSLAEIEAYLASFDRLALQSNLLISFNPTLLLFNNFVEVTQSRWWEAHLVAVKPKFPVKDHQSNIIQFSERLFSLIYSASRGFCCKIIQHFLLKRAALRFTKRYNQ